MNTLTLIVSIIGVVVAIVIYIHQKIDKIAKINKQIEKYDETLSNPLFLEWQIKIFKDYYGEDCLTTVCNRDYPAYCFPNIDGCNYSFDNLCNKDNLDTKRKEFNFEKMKYYKIYKILEEPELLDIRNRKVRYPNRWGFMLEKLDLCDNFNIKSLSAWVGMFKDNVYTSHILEYELYMLYKKHKKYNLNNKKVISKMKLRNKIHNIKSPQKKLELKDLKKELSLGHNRASLIIVQMMIIIKDHEDDDYKILTIIRSNNVADRPGFFQFVPTGGFETLEGTENEKNIIEQFSVKYALLREYAEELFGQDFDGKGSANTITLLKNNKYIKGIEELLANGEAKLYFLGSIVGLVSLKNELSFVLIIKDKEYSRNVIFDADEIEIRNKEIIRYSFNDIEEKISGPKFNPPSAVLYKQFKESKLYKEIMENQ